MAQVVIAMAVRILRLLLIAEKGNGGGFANYVQFILMVLTLKWIHIYIIVLTFIVHGSLVIILLINILIILLKESGVKGILNVVIVNRSMT
jgi:hypothetical protein